MKTTNKELMAQARAALKNNWKLAVTTIALVTLIRLVTGAIPGLSVIMPMLIAGPLALGVSVFALSISRGTEAELNQAFDGFERFGTALATYMLSVLFIILWALLLVVPGIIAALSYSQIYFILADNPDIGPMEAIDRSKKMMMGNKWKFFCLGLRFFGWMILSVLTLGIGFLWLMPYMTVTFAKFYDDVKNVEDDEVVEVIEIIETVTTE